MEHHHIPLGIGQIKDRGGLTIVTEVLDTRQGSTGRELETPHISEIFVNIGDHYQETINIYCFFSSNILFEHIGKEILKSSTIFLQQPLGRDLSCSENQYIGNLFDLMTCPTTKEDFIFNITLTY